MGDLIIAGRSIAVSGVVEDDVRAAGAELRFHSSVGEDLIVAGYQIELASGAVIGQDLVAGGNTLDISGDIDGNLDLDANEAVISGTVGGNVQAIVEEQLTLGPDARIGGELNYTSTNEVSMQPGAKVDGVITQRLPTLEIFGNEFPITGAIVFVGKLIEQAKWFIGTLLVGLALIWLYPTALSQVIQTFTGSPFKSLGIGILILPLMPLVFLIMMIAILSSVGFSAFPVVAIPATVYAALLLLAKPIVAILIGDCFARHLKKRENPSAVGALAFGAAILAALGMIPYVDSIVGWLTLLSGFGMWLLYLFRRYRAARSARTV
jgi:cytoskeletal protein CcmA (bactofilin family)